MKSHKWNPCKYEKCPSDSHSHCEDSCSEMMSHQHCLPKEDECCHIPKMKFKCTPTKECVKSFKCYYKLYRFTHYRLFKVCNVCGHEFDHYHHHGRCPKCR